MVLRMVGCIAITDVFYSFNGGCKPFYIHEVNHAKNLLSFLIVITITYQKTHVKHFLFKLRTVQTIVEPPRLHQFVVRHLLDNVSLVYYQDIVSVPDCG